MKRVLLIAYYFPPCGGAGVQRWLKLLGYLVQNNWMPTVITTSAGDYPVFDPSLCKKIPANIKVIRTKTPVWSKIFSFLTGSDKGIPHGNLQCDINESFMTKLCYWVRINMITPDSRVIWNKHAFMAAEKEIRKGKYDIIITTGPPHSTHLVGMKLRKKYPLKWVVDMRDPWTGIFYLQSLKQNKMLLKVNRRWEKQVIANADMNTIVSKTVSEKLPDGKKYVLYNGYDSVDFLNTEQVNSALFRIKYVGKLTFGQDIDTPLKWLDKMVLDQKITAPEFSFIGTFDEEKTVYSEKNPHLLVRSRVYTSHTKAINEMVNADLLILLINKCPDNKGILTTKIFEYIGSMTYIIGIGPVDGEAAEMLRTYNAGVMVDYNDKKGFTEAVESIFKKWSKKENIKNTSDVKALSVAHQAKEFVKVLDQLIEKE